jgi:peptide deformylase
MILPIVAYGDPVLRKETEDIEADYPGLSRLINDMWETMYNADGLGLAAPQIGKSIRLFIVDTGQLKDGEAEGIKKVFINATLLSEEGKPWNFEEGCLSIPGVREEVLRKPEIELEYLDENFEYHRETFKGLNARVIQHEYDHVEGILFTDHLKALKKRLIRRKLINISKGEIEVHYRMRFPALQR